MFTEGRPTGVTVVAVLAGLSGVPPLVFGFIGAIGAGATWLSAADQPAIPALVTAIYFLAIAVAYFAVAYGLLDLRPWAWLVALVVTALAVAGNVVAAIAGNLGWPQAIVASIVPGLVVWYLGRAEVRRAFGR